MRVVIAGGGVAGLTIAGLLSRTGSHEVTVLEKAERYGEAGYGIGLYPIGGAVFHALGKTEDLRRRSVPLTQYEVHGPDGAVLQSVDLASLLERFGPMVGIRRDELIDILASCVPDGCIRFGESATAVEMHADGLSVVNDKGETFDADAVIAADGMNSTIRTQVFGPVEPHDTGFHAWMWWAPSGSTGPGTAAEYWGPSAFVGLYPMPDGVNVAVALPAIDSPDPLSGREAILAALSSRVAASIPSAVQLPGIWDAQGEPFLWPMRDVRAPALTAMGDRLALCGDSGLGFLPTAGVGASNALRSAAALAFELSLADSRGAPLAIRHWAERAGKVVRKNQDDSRSLARLMMVRHKSTSAVVNSLMRHLPVTTMTRSIISSMEQPF